MTKFRFASPFPIKFVDVLCFVLRALLVLFCRFDYGRKVLDRMQLIVSTLSSITIFGYIFLLRSHSEINSIHFAILSICRHSSIFGFVSFFFFLFLILLEFSDLTSFFAVSIPAISWNEKPFLRFRRFVSIFCTSSLFPLPLSINLFHFSHKIHIKSSPPPCQAPINEFTLVHWYTQSRRNRADTFVIPINVVTTRTTNSVPDANVPGALHETNWMRFQNQCDYLPSNSTNDKTARASGSSPRAASEIMCVCVCMCHRESLSGREQKRNSVLDEWRSLRARNESTQ